jgi:hypothetical protein
MEMVHRIFLNGCSGNRLIILTGARATGIEARPTAPAMPSLGCRLNDSQIAPVVTYIRNSWVNAAARVEADTVKTLRGRLN